VDITEFNILTLSRVNICQMNYSQILASSHLMSFKGSCTTGVWYPWQMELVLRTAQLASEIKYQMGYFNAGKIALPYISTTLNLQQI